MFERLRQLTRSGGRSGNEYECQECGAGLEQQRQVCPECGGYYIERIEW